MANRSTPPLVSPTGGVPGTVAVGCGKLATGVEVAVAAGIAVVVESIVPVHAESTAMVMASTIATTAARRPTGKDVSMR